MHRLSGTIFYIYVLQLILVQIDTNLCKRVEIPI